MLKRSKLHPPVETPKVKARFEHNGRVFRDVNPTARNPALRNGELLPTPKGSKGMTAINSNTASCHAELGAMNQSYKAGNKGGKGVLTVSGENVCKYCKQDIKKMAKSLELDELVVHEAKTGKKYIFKGPPATDFENVMNGGKKW